ncbi:MAG TPA: DUF1611 domain-containing protein [Bacteroidota bacterium]|nr:DUF1611 domain-containing protein [Bacteroidota bacterium]
MNPQRRMIVLAEGRFHPLESKTANQAIRYMPEQVVAVIDSTQAGKSVDDVIGYGGKIPVVRDLKVGLSRKPDTLLIGIAPMGGILPDSWRAIVREAIENKLSIISGLHTFLSDDVEFAALAKKNSVSMTELRKIPPTYEVVAEGHWRKRKAKTILSIGTDCNVGKMTASLELHREFVRRGLKSDFVPTGQTGILLAGKGVAVDSILSDYVAGAIELEVERSAATGAEYIHVEGQGSILHQGYSSVTLGLMHGVVPDAMILVHHPIRQLDYYGFPINDVKKFIAVSEMILEPFKKSKVVGIAVNAVGMSPAEISDAISRLEGETGLPAADVLSPGKTRLADALVTHLRTQTETRD